MKNTNKTYLATLEIPDQQKTNPEVLRIILHSDYTRIDFGYVAEWIYEKGGWIRIAPETFIQVHGSENRYRLTEAHNIAIAPNHHHFESTEDWQVFTLIFEPIPIQNCTIDIIEAEDPDEDDFNFYGIKINQVKEIEILEAYSE